MKQMRCEKGHSAGISDIDNFCFMCGTPVREAVASCQCGRSLSTADHYCPNCGKAVPTYKPPSLADVGVAK